MALAGSFRGTAQHGDTTLTSRGGPDAFALHLDGTNTRINLLHVGGPGADTGRAVGLAEYSSFLGRVLLTGSFEDSMQVGDREVVSAGETDRFLAGRVGFGWPSVLRMAAIRGGGPGDDEGPDIGFVMGFYGDTSAPVPVLTGVITGSATFDGHEIFETLTLEGDGGQDGFVFSHDGYGVHALAALGGTGDDVSWGIGGSGDYLQTEYGQGLLTGTFQQRATLGMTTVEGDVQPDGFVADYPGGELAPNYVSAEPAPVDRALTIVAFPNPARDAVTLHLHLGAEAEAAVEIIDVLGRRVAVVHLGRLPAGESRLRASVSGLAPGAYGVRVGGEATLLVGSWWLAETG